MFVRGRRCGDAQLAVHKSGPAAASASSRQAALRLGASAQLFQPLSFRPDLLDMWQTSDGERDMGPGWDQTNWNVYKRDRMRCVYGGLDGSQDAHVWRNFLIDHLFPVSTCRRSGGGEQG